MASSERTEAFVATTTAAPATVTGGAAAGGNQTSRATPTAIDAVRPSMTTPHEASTIDGLRCDLLMNARYHASREAFLDTVHRWLMFLVIVFGAAAIIDLLPKDAPLEHAVKAIFAALTAILAAIDLAFDLSNRARAHALMKRRYFELLADLIEGQKSVSVVEGCMHRFSADEEPAYHALLGAAWNAAQEMVYGQHADRYDIPWWHSWLKNWFRFGRKYAVIVGPRPEAIPA